MIQQDLNQASSSGSLLIEPSELTKTRLTRKYATEHGAASSSSYIPVYHQPAESVLFPVEAKCGGVVEDVCKKSRDALSSCFRRAGSALEQLGVLEQMKDENRIFKRLFEKDVSTSSADPITTGALCGRCSPFYKQKMRTVLLCYKKHCNGDIARFLEKHRLHSGNERVVDGKVVMAKFNAACQCEGYV